MKVIYVPYPHSFQPNDFPLLSAAIGFFDGVHVGHQHVIQQAKEKASEFGHASAVLTFDPHPKSVLQKGKPLEMISSLEQRIEYIRKMNVDYLFVFSFTEAFSHLTPQEFIDHFIIQLHIKHLVAGEDFSYGMYGKGTMDTLPFHSRDAFTFQSISIMRYDGEKISSTRIRSFVISGRVGEVKPLLGRFFSTIGLVIHGDQRGRTIGFPTANMELRDDFIYPDVGVYAVFVHVNTKRYFGMANIGYRPTFHQNHTKSVEVHLLDFEGDLYHQVIEVEWVEQLRKEQKFDSVEKLIKQLQDDREKAIKILVKS